jgi:hypothetical protein
MLAAIEGWQLTNSGNPRAEADDARPGRLRNRFRGIRRELERWHMADSSHFWPRVVDHC